LSLSRLDRRQAAAVVEAIAADHPLPQAVVEQIVAESDGVPLFAEELTKTVVDAARHGGEAVMAAGGLLIPTTLQDSLMARLDRLGPVKEVAQLAATIGRSFSRPLLAAVMPADGHDLEAALAALEDANLVFRRGVAPDVGYLFKHALVQEAAYKSLLKRDRQRHHETIARALETRFPDWAASEPELVAYHFTEAGRRDAAIDYWLRAGRRAAESVANLEAIAHLRRGLDLIATASGDQTDRDKQELALQVALGSPLIAAKGYLSPETNQCYERARELCHRLDDPPDLFPILFGLWVTHLIRAELIETRSIAEDFVRRAEAGQNRVALLTSHRALGSVLLVLADFSGARDHLERALKVYDPTSDRSLGHVYTMDPKVTALSYLACSHWCLGYPDKALSLLAEARAFGELVAHPYSVALGLMFDAVVHLLCGRSAQALDSVETCLDIANEHGFPYWLAFMRIIKGWALVDQDRMDDGVAELTEGLARYREIEGRLYWPMAYRALAEGHAKQGQAEQALEAINQALAAADETEERWFEAELHRFRGDVLAAARQSAEAEAAYSRALGLAREQGARSWELRAATSLARLWREQGKLAEASALLTPIYAEFTEGHDTNDLQQAKALLDELT
jgi:predicted ATPase